MPHFEPDIDKFRRRLNDFRTDTLDKTAKMLNVGKRTYQDWINPHREKWPSVDNLIKLANTYEVTTDYILGISDYQTPQNHDIGNEIGLTDEAIDKLRGMKQADQVTALQIISDILTNPLFSDILSQFITLYSLADLQKPKTQKALSEVFQSFSDGNRELADKVDKDHIQLTMEELADFKLKGKAVASIAYLLDRDNDANDKAIAIQEISRLSGNLAESFYQLRSNEDDA